MPSREEWIASYGSYEYRIWRQASRYRMKPEQLDALLIKQVFMCAICHNDIGNGIKFSIDHDYTCCGSSAIKRTCGKCTRSLLCQSCNLLVGAIEKAKKLGLLDKVMKYAANNDIVDEWLELKGMK